MGRVTGIGGVFFRCKDAAAQRDWYQNHLGLNTDQYGTNFAWRSASNPDAKGYTQWSPFTQESEYFEGEFMLNYRVEDLDGLLANLRADGVEILGEVTQETYGKFVHIRDGEGFRVELWEPNDAAYEDILEGVTST